MLTELLTRLFSAPEEINGMGRCPTYLYRWHILATPWGKVYLHKFVGSDWSRDLHDHPKRFISIGLWGQYREDTPAGSTIYRAPWARSFPAEHRHRLSIIDGPCWTLVVVLKTVREWGFWHQEQFIPWRDYVHGKGGIADKMKSCD